MKKLVAFSALPVLFATAPAWAASYEIAPGANLSQEIAKLKAGDELVLKGGTYTLSGKLTVSVAGTANAPIVIRSKDGETAHITRDASQNVINVENTKYVVLRKLEVSKGSHGIRITNSSFITVEDCHIHDTADVAVSANVGGSKYEGLVIRRNHIHHTNGTGEGMYLGCNNDGCQMFDSLIEGNYVHHTNQSSVSQGDGIEIKQGSYNNIVRDNVIHDTNYPCILIYGTAGKAVNLLERNAMWNCGDHGIQAEADAIIRNNLVLGAKADGIRNQLHQQQSVEDLTIVHNTVLNAGDALRSDGIKSNVVIANNALYSQNGNALRVAGTLSALTVAGNVGMGSTQGVSAGFTGGGSLGADFIDAAFGGAKLNVFPKAGGKLISAGDTKYVVGDDFNGTPRGGVADVGAYKFGASNPGWTLGAGFKDPTASGGTGGTGGTGGAGTGGASTGGASTGGSAGSPAGGSAGSPAGGSAGASTGGSSTGGSSSGGSGTGGAKGDDSGADDGGCGCRATPTGSSPGWAGFAALALLLFRRRR